MKQTVKYLTLALAVALLTIISGCTTKPPSVKATEDKNIDSLSQTKAGFDTWGRRWGQTPVAKTAVAPAPAPAPAAAPAPEPAPVPLANNCSSEVKTSIVDMVKKVPPQAALGDEIACELDVTALSCIGNVVVVDHVPDGASFVRSDPPADVNGTAITWKLGDIDVLQSVVLKVWLKAEREGSLMSCATIAADPRICAGTVVGKATLTLDKSGLATAPLGADVTYTLAVKNTGTAAAHGVVVSDPAPDGLTGDSVNVNVGDLEAGQSTNITATFKADRRGKVCNDATVTASNCDKVTAEACTDVQAAGIKIDKSGDQTQILGRKAAYDITVSNTGDTELTNITVVDTAPDGTSIAEAADATVAGQKATWTIESLAAGDKKDFTIKLTGQTAGEHDNVATVKAGALSDSAQVATVWRGVAGVLLQLVDDPDPIQVGDNVTYTIRVINQGFADIHNVGMTAEFGAQVDPVSAPAGTVNGKTVNFPVLPMLGPKKMATYTITGKGIVAGDNRTKATLTCDEIKSPVTQEESTTVY